MKTSGDGTRYILVRANKGQDGFLSSDSMLDQKPQKWRLPLRYLSGPGGFPVERPDLAGNC